MPSNRGLRRLLGVLTVAAALSVVAAWRHAMRAQGRGLEHARVLFQASSPHDLRAAVAALAVTRRPGDCLASAEALARAQLLAEFGEDPDSVAPAISAAEPERATCSDLRLAEGIAALARGDVPAAQAALADAQQFQSTITLAPLHHRWLAGMLALGTGENTAEALAGVQALCGESAARALDLTASALTTDLTCARLLARLHLQAGDGPTALAVLARARDAARSHLGLAADEALANATLRREFSGVADLSDQLLARSDPSSAPTDVPPAEAGLHAAPGDPDKTPIPATPTPSATDPLGLVDRAHALLARAIVHVHTGEPAAGLARADTAWPLLPWWDRAARGLALDLALEAGDSARVRAWLPAAALSPTDAALHEAWALLVDGDVMASLAALAALPQDHPRVAYLQGLALVEQRRWDEADPWLARAETFYPGRVELEVARARVTVHLGDRATALRKLTGLAEEEVHAPRAWTGLGEAHLAVLRARAPQPDDPSLDETDDWQVRADLSEESDDRDLRAAQKALTRAVEREPRAAEAMLLLAQVWQRRHGAPEAERNARTWLEQAAATNPKLPRYREALARFLADSGETDRAETMLRALVDEPGAPPGTSLALADLVLTRAVRRGQPPPPEVSRWLTTAEQSGAEAGALARTRAHADLALGTATSLRAAASRLEARLAREPADIDARVLLAQVRLAQHDEEEAESLLRGGIYQVGAASSGRLFLAWAHLELRQHKRKQAALHARAALRRMSDEGRPSSELLEAADLAVSLFVRTDSVKLATGLTRGLTTRLPDSTHAWRLEARAQLAASEVSRARHAIARALAIAPEDPLNLEVQGQIALRTGDRKTGRTALGRALELTTDAAAKKRIHDLLRRAPA
jgi:tetratricopeptide (TPR) repeat protein